MKNPLKNNEIQENTKCNFAGEEKFGTIVCQPSLLTAYLSVNFTTKIG